MKASVCIEMIYVEYPFLDRIKIAADQGFDAVEFWDWDNKDLPAIKKTAQEAGVGVAIFGSKQAGSLINPGDRDALVNGVKESFKVAQEMGTQRLFLLTDQLGEDRSVTRQFPHLTEQEKRQNVIDGLRAMAPLAESAGVSLLLEPLNTTVDHAGYWLKYSKDGFDLVREINSPNIRLVFDIYHQQVTEGNIIDRLTNNLDAVAHVHVADVPGRHQPGSGELNYAVIFEKLRRAGYNGYVGLEFSPTIPSKVAASQALELIRG